VNPKKLHRFFPFLIAIAVACAILVVFLIDEQLVLYSQRSSALSFVTVSGLGVGVFRGLVAAVLGLLAHRAMGRREQLAAADRELERANLQFDEEARQAKQSEMRSRLMFSANPCPMWIFDCDTLAMREVNEAALRQYGYTRDEFLALSVLDLRPREESDHFMSRLNSAGPGYGCRGNWRHVRKDGSPLQVEICVFRFLEDGRTLELVAAQDVTGRVKAKEALRISEEALQSLVKHAPFGICNVSLGKDCFEDFNSAMCDVIGYNYDEMMGLKVSTQVCADAKDVQRAGELLRRDRKLAAFETTLLRKDGTAIRVRIWGVLKDENGGTPDKANFYVQDLTEQSALEQQVRQVQKLEAVGRLAGGIAHDFNNVLVVIRLSTEMMLGEVTPESPLSKPLLQVLNAADRAAALTRQLLAFGRQQVMQSRTLNLNSVVADTLHLLQRTIGEDIELVTHLHEDLQNTQLDPDQLAQVIMNLAINARDAMPRGGSLQIETQNVMLDASYVRTHGPVRPGHYVMLAVTDTGSGIEKSLLPRIFDPFFTTKEVGKGTGLGLSIVYGIVKQSGGYIWVYSEPGQGATFKLYFPVTDAAAEPVLESGVVAVSEVQSTILVVEDEAQIRAQLRECLHQIGYQVLEAADGAEALSLFEQHAGGVDLVLTDLVMPRMSGAELAGKLIAMEPNVAILFMSGYTEDSAARRELLSRGAVFLPKPFSVADLSGAVQRALAIRVLSSAN
jgi:PAS domain S-box-containing protein